VVCWSSASAYRCPADADLRRGRRIFDGLAVPCDESSFEFVTAVGIGSVCVQNSSSGERINAFPPEGLRGEGEQRGVAVAILEVSMSFFFLHVASGRRILLQRWT